VLPGPEAQPRNPNWSREELILALELYFRHSGRDPGDTHPEVLDLSALLQRMATQAGLETFRNGNGVAMKLMNFRSLDPAFLSKGGTSLSDGKGSKYSH
jgi:5-methylcytosine-specific restriction protein A